MKVTLVFSHIGVAGMNSKRLVGDREGSWIGHGAASVGASAKQAGFDVDLVDLRRLSGFDDFEKIVSQNPSDVYGISVSAVDHWHAMKAIIVIRQNAPDAKVVVGGIHPTIFPEEYNYEAIDTVVIGEGEVAFVDILSKIQNNDDLPHIYHGAKPDLDSIPWVDRELFDYRHELECNFTPDQGHPSITMLAGRGCPFKCAYCQTAENAVFGKPYRMRSPENVVGELKHLHKKYGFKSITFWDDTFTFRPKWVNEFCDLYEASEIKADIVACSRADIICNNESMVERLSQVGLKWFVIGLESGSQRILDLIKKGTTVEQNIESGKICRKHGVKVFGTYMYGLPTETNADALATAKMIDTIRPEHPSPFWFIPIKGTDIYSYCVDNDLILEDAKNRTIERTGKFLPTIKGVDYAYITKLMQGKRNAD